MQRESRADSLLLWFSMVLPPDLRALGLAWMPYAPI
jgi:hypothetical protein